MFKLALGCEAATLLNIEMLANELPIGSLLHRRNARIETRKLREVKISAAPAAPRTPWGPGLNIRKIEARLLRKPGKNNPLVIPHSVDHATLQRPEPPKRVGPLAPHILLQ